MRNFTKVKFWLLLMVMGLSTLTFAQTEPKLGVSPNPLDLGEWPIGGWQENAYLSLTNDGVGTLTVTSSDLDDPSGVFALTNPSLPVSISALDPAVMVGVAFDASGVSAGTYNATYVATWGANKSVTAADITVTAYAPVVGDIFENPFMIALPYSAAGESTALPMRSNYHTPGAAASNGKDVVYKFTLTEDKEVNITISNSTETPKMAVYAADFDGEAGPMIDNAVASAGASVTNLPLFAGTYYLVIAASADDAAMTYDLDITATTMPAAECIVNPMPADGAVEVPSNGIVLSWEYGQFTQEYQLLFGTTYPPSDVLMDWTAINPMGDSYALPNLDPSMQYFWQVNVRNNNQTTSCDVYGFTTTITPPSNLTATIIEIAEDEYNVKLNWTASAKSLLSYNIYRDGSFIATTNAGVNTYTDLDLAYNMNPCYEYYVEAIFDEGVSAPSNTATACITGVGTVDGTVTELLTGNPISGATVELASETGGRSYTFTTDVVGNYVGEVLEDTYTYTVSADGYITETRTGVAVAYNTTVTEDFQLDEFPYPVNDVVAYEINDNTVQVDWGNNGGGGGSIAEWLFYDDGTNVDGIGGPATFTWAIKFDASQLVDFNNCSVSKFQFYARTNETFHFMVMQGDNAEDVIYTEDFTGLTLDTWNEVTLATPAAFDNSQALWIGFYTTNGGAYPASCGATTGELNGELISLDGVVWEHLSDYGLPYTWNLRGFVTDANGKSYSLTKVNAPEYKNDNTPIAAAHVAPVGNATIPATANSSDKDLMGYNVYRQVCNEATPMQFLGMTLDNQFTDNTWGAADWGTYKWAVEVIYTNNVSEVAYSNCLDKDMEAVVGVEVTTNSGDAPEGCQILFTNTSEPELGLTYELELDGTGMATIDPFRKGTYDIMVHLAGYGDITETGVLVSTDTTFVWQLIELLAPPTDLYVTPTGFATWSGGGEVPFEPFFENFDTQDQFDMWEVIVGGSNSDTWHWVVSDGGSTIDGTPFAFVDSDAAGIGSTMDEMLISPVIDASNASDLFVNFDEYYNYFSGAEYADVDVWDGSAWVNVLHQTSDQGSWASPAHKSIDVTAYANNEFRVRFHYYAPGWDWYWAVDNVSVTEEAGKTADKGFQFYKVWHDGVFSTDTDTTFYQYGDNGEQLVAGETYLAEVAALYSTGLSTKSQYSWTYMPCDSFPAPGTLFAANVTGSDDVLVNWTDMIPMELVQINQGYGDPQNGYFQNFGYGYGVSYDFTQYPDALVDAVSFRHSSWGTMGTWNYSIHIINRDNNTEIAEIGPFQTTGNDTWEEMVELGDISTGGATEVAILMEPMGNLPTDAYPCLDSDNDGDPQGSIYGDLSNLAGLGASGIGNFLMDVYIYTANAGKIAAPVVMNNIEGPAATPRVTNNNTFAPNQIVMQQEVADKAAKAMAVAIGTNVYRDGEMVAFVPNPDTFYLDMNLEPGYYDYCIATVYTEDDGLHTWTSCEGSTCVTDVLVPEDCLAPENLTAEDLLGDGYTATLNWDAPNSFDPIWLQYDDGTNVDAIGGPTEFSVAAKWDPAQLADYDGTAVTKVKFFPREAGSSFTLKIWKGTNAGTLLLEQPLSGLTFDAWNEITLNTPVEIDVTQQLWIGYYVVTSGYPAGCGNFTGNANSDYVSLDGVVWEHLADYGLPYSWNLGAYVEAAKGQVIELPAVVDHATYNSTDANLVAGNLTPAVNAVDPFSADRALMGYNVYRDGVQVNTDVVTETTYADEVGVAGHFCYEVTAVYSVCGESDPSNEACVDVAIGINELENNISVYPNPANDFVMVEASSDIRSIVITNYMGQVVNSVKAVENTQYRINTSDLSAGVYFIEVETTAGIEKVRIVISE